MRSRSAGMIAGVALGLVFRADAGPAASDAVVSAQQAAASLAVRDVAVREDVVSGRVINQSGRPLRDVRLLIRYAWLWRDEHAPGDFSPGRAVYHTLPDEIPAGASVSFTYHPSPPLLRLPEGHFEVSVEVVGFTEVGE